MKQRDEAAPPAPDPLRREASETRSCQPGRRCLKDLIAMGMAKG